jgi:hypothetical protein
MEDIFEEDGTHSDKEKKYRLDYERLELCHRCTKNMMFYFAGVTVGIIIAHMLLRGD